DRAVVGGVERVERRLDISDLARTEPVTPRHETTAGVDHEGLLEAVRTDVLGEQVQLVVGQHREQVRERVDLAGPCRGGHQTASLSIGRGFSSTLTGTFSARA